MADKVNVPLVFSVSVEEQFFQPAHKRWHAQFMFHPHGYFRGNGRTPGAALSLAWRRFERAISPGKRWWTIVMR